MTLVRMINSVGEHIAGEEIELPEALADSFIVKGYADGALSREYTQGERDEILQDVQVVNA